MSTSQTIDTATTSPIADAGVPPAAGSDLTDRVKNGLVVVRRRIDAAPAQLRAVPAQIREAIDRLARATRERVRASLNLPSQAEIEALIARVEELDRKLAALTQPATEPSPAADPADKKSKKKNGR